MSKFSRSIVEWRDSPFLHGRTYAPSSSHVRDLLVERLEALLHDCEHVMDTSAHRHIILHRHYRRCPHCKKHFFPSDVTLGLETGYSNGLKRLAARCCGLWSYRLSEENLQEFLGIHLTVHNVKAMMCVTTGDDYSQPRRTVNDGGEVLNGVCYARFSVYQ